MPRVQASFVLPYMLELKSGQYLVGQSGLKLDVGEPRILHGFEPKTVIAISTEQPDTEDHGEQEKLNASQAKQLLTLTNRLIRCYRAVTQDSTITELSRTKLASRWTSLEKSWRS
jgi:hypothetical protein